MYKFLYLPEQHTDFAYAVFSQEFGFIGSVVVMCLFMGFLMCGFSCARQLKQPYESLLVYGLTLLISIQGIINMAMVIGCFPVTGIPLPFISYGGTSLLTNVISVGLILGAVISGRLFTISRHNREIFHESVNRLAGISYKQLAELAERYPDENQGMSLVIVFMVPDESAKKKALSLCHFLDRQGIKAGLFFAGHQSVLSNRVEALARIRAADSFVIVTKDLEESGLFAHAARCMEKQGLIIYEGALTRKLITCVTKMEINSFFAEESVFSYPVYADTKNDIFCLAALCLYAVHGGGTILEAADEIRKMLRN